MALPRFRIQPADVHGSTAVISDPAEAHHAMRVLRLRAGDACLLFDDTGAEYHGRISVTNGDALTVAIDAFRSAPSADAQLTLTLVQALPKPPAFEQILRHATELGVTRIVPLLTARTVVRLSAAQWPVKRARWERILTSAAKQCQRATIPALMPPQTWGSWLTSQPLAESVAIMPTLAVPAPSLASVLDGVFLDRRPPTAERRAVSASVILCIGPEGDFTREEVASFLERGGHTASLGPRILRTETAALTVIAIIRHEWSRHA